MTVAKVSPRQKMINVMYLILTAMLALNVSAEILKAFFLMETSMDNTGVNIELKNEEILQSFDRLMITQPEIVRPYHDKAKQAEKLNADFNQYVENLKNILIEQTGGREESEDGSKTELKGRDDIEKHANYLINEGRGKELMAKINETREQLLALLPENDRKNVRSDLLAEDYGTQSWASFHFEHSPLAAVVAMMSKIQNDCKVTTNEVLRNLHSYVGVNTLPIDRVEAAIIPSSSYLMRGDMFEADIMLTAFSTKQAHEIYINGEKVAEEKGKFTYRMPTSTPGAHTINGEIWVRESDSLRKYPFSTTYNVFSAGANISADNTKILYTGYDNPLTISIPGVAPSNVKVELSQGNLTKRGDDKYIARLTQTGKIKVKVSVKDDFGNWKNMGEEEFVVRNLPGAELSFGTLKGDKPVSRGALMAQNIVVAGTGGAYIKDLQYKVTSCDVLIFDARNGLQAPVRITGDRIPESLKTSFRNMAPGSMVIFENIKVDKKPGISYGLTLRINR
ncbi:MAG: gliding motility protein GldM [Bacteroidota bacterium]|nr:gliding motility protein GldM [Bacteroidota bacterium]MDX5430213.1 gliding motility protein GldM [Bacteroidota bacterium]MDX5468975.1 gliding motility protein GldM [Bacteroidota bacterium]